MAEEKGHKKEKLFHLEWNWWNGIDRISKYNETTIVECCYTCNESDCDFNKAIKQIENSGELKGLGVKLITESVVKTIAENPKVFPSCGLGGYIIQYSGRPYLILKNNTINFKQNDDCRYGLLERDEIMKSVLSEGKRQQDVVRGSFVVLFTVYLSYLLKKMK